MIPSSDPNAAVRDRLLAVYDALYRHNGFGEMTVEVRILKRQQKEVLIKCGKQYRFVVDWVSPAGHPAPAQPPPPAPQTAGPAPG
jgi:hypothetical protein